MNEKICGARHTIAVDVKVIVDGQNIGRREVKILAAEKYGSVLARVFFTVQLVGAVMCSACLRGSHDIMPFADQIPVKSTHSMMRWHIVGCPDRRIDRLCITCVRPPNLASRRLPA